MTPEEKRYTESRRRRREALRRQRKKRRIRIAILAACCAGLAAFLIWDMIHIRKMRGREEPSSSETAEVSSEEESLEPVSSETEPVSSQEEEVSSEEESTESSSEPESVSEPESEPEPEPLPPEKPFCDGSSEWTYTTDEAMPDGQIVSTESAHYSYDDMRRDLYFLQERYSGLVEVRNFGTTLDDRELLEAVVGSEDAQGDLIIQYTIHAREYMNTLLCMRQLEELLANYRTGTWDGKTYEEILSKVRLHIIPMMNPDGIMISEDGIDAIRNEELRNYLWGVYDSDVALGKWSADDSSGYWQHWKANARAVDLNRNFATAGWSTEMGTQQPSCTRYPGPEPHSEPEVRALLSLTDSMNTIGQISYHSLGRLVYCDYGMEPVNPELYQTDMELARLVSSLTGVQFDPYEVVSTVAADQNTGGCSDYYMQVLELPAITIETGRRFKDNGDYNDTPLTIDQFPLIWAENQFTVPAIAGFFADRM